MLLGKNVAPLPPFENFQIRQTMCVLIATFSNMATNDQAIVNPPASFRSAVWKYYGFPTKDGTTNKSRTICKICFATFKYCAASTSSMSAHLKSQHSIDEKSEVLQSKTANYKVEETMPLNSNPLLWWEANELKYPIWSKS